MANNEKPKGLKGRRKPLSFRGGAGVGESGAVSPERPGRQRPLALSSDGEGENVRTCVLSGDKAPRDRLIRLALGPDGTVAPDVRAKAGGRGAWIGVDRATLERAMAKGKLKGGLARAFRTANFVIPADLPEKIEEALRRATLDRLGLEARAGTLLTGAEKIAEAARKGTVDLLLHARDAAVDGSRKLDQAMRVGLGIEGSGEEGLVIPAGRAILSMALGRENVVHIALIAPAAAARVSDALGRWHGFLGRDEATGPCDDASQGPSALPIE